MNFSDLRTQVGFRALHHLGGVIVPVLCRVDSLQAKNRDTDTPTASHKKGESYASTRVVIAVPRSDYESTAWKPGGGNYCFELMASATERYGDDAVSIFALDDDAPYGAWQTSLIRYLEDIKATHCVAFVESDPAQAGPWHWNEFAARARRAWGGTFVGVLTDGAYLLHQARATRFRRAFPRSVFVAIDVTSAALAGYVPPHTIYGPCFLPISDSSVEALCPPESASTDQREFDIVFVGKVYPNREAFLEELRASGLRVGVNPHRTDPLVRPDFAGYVNGLRQGHFTVNLSEAGGTSVHQLKSRMLEGPLFGTIVCTDEEQLARRFFDGDEFVFFDSAQSLKAAIIPILDDPRQLERMRTAAQSRAGALAGASFWESVETGIRANGLNSLRPQSRP
jgi:hypothetical protein